MAADGRQTYPEAVNRLHLRRRGFAAAAPRSVRVIGRASDFVYRQGVLCSINGSELSVITVSGPTNFAHTLDLAGFLPPNSPADQSTFVLLNYSEGVIVVRFFPQADSVSSQLVAIDVKSRAVKGTVLLHQQCDELFVRHTANFLYYGTHTGRGDHNHHEWVIQGVSLDPTHCFEVRPCVQLRNFAGSDIGSTVAFEIHDGYFYALSNQTSFDTEEVDWTSFYHCIRFPLHNPITSAIEGRRDIFRRQHEEGPLNDRWTDLGFQVDERTNKLLIVEARREWQAGSSAHVRRFYARKIQFREDGEEPTPRQLHPTDPMGPLAGDSNNPHYAPSEPRNPKHVHLEYGFENDSAPSFILSRTKFRCYNWSCSAFLDVVEDPACCGGKYGQMCLRLRIGARIGSPRIPCDPLPEVNRSGPSRNRIPLLPPKDSVQPFRYEPIRMWPPPPTSSQAAAGVHVLLNPKPKTATSPYPVQMTTLCAADERSIVIMRKPVRPKNKDDESGEIILVNFDPFDSFDPINRMKLAQNGSHGSDQAR